MAEQEEDLLGRNKDLLGRNDDLSARLETSLGFTTKENEEDKGSDNFKDQLALMEREQKEQVALMKKEQGTLILFPSYVLHEVKPVTKGERNSLVSWVTGKQFK